MCVCVYDEREGRIKRKQMETISEKEGRKEKCIAKNGKRIKGKKVEESGKIGRTRDRRTRRKRITQEYSSENGIREANITSIHIRQQNSR